MYFAVLVQKSCRRVALLGIMAGLLGGCHSASPDDRQAWFIESYGTGGVVTVRHDGMAYKAICDGSRSFNNASSITDHLVELPTCDTTMGLVGHAVQPSDGKQWDGDGRVVIMSIDGNTLTLRSWRDEHSPGTQENFRITSVLPIQ
jgi:hypothetical protein